MNASDVPWCHFRKRTYKAGDPRRGMGTAAAAPGWHTGCGPTQRDMTLKRIRAYAPLIAITLWSVLLIDLSDTGVVDRLGKIKGTDFLQFYVSGSFIHEGRADLLYNVRAQFLRAQAIAPGSDETWYVPIQSPQTALAFAPLAAYRYTAALTIWLLVVVLLYAAACWITWRSCTALHAYRAETVACCVAFPGFFSTVLHGQTSCVALVAVAAASVALRRGRSFSAGLAFGCLVFKPHWVAVAGAIFAAAREWRVIAGLLMAAVAQLGLAYLVVGSVVIKAYWMMLRSVQNIADVLEPRASNTLKGFFTALVPSEMVAGGLYTVAAVVTLVVTARIWRSDERFELRFSAVVLAMILISPHAFEYDLILLAPVYFLLANWIADSPNDRAARAMSFALPVLFVAPVLTGLPAVIRLQFSVTAMGFILFVLSRKRDPVQVQIIV
jgi:hypothetical protein